MASSCASGDLKPGPGGSKYPVNASEISNSPIMETDFDIDIKFAYEQLRRAKNDDDKIRFLSRKTLTISNRPVIFISYQGQNIQ